MAIGKYLSLEEARKKGLIDRFCKEHPSAVDTDRFQQLLDAATTPVADREASARVSHGSCNETQTLSGTSKDTS